MRSYAGAALTRQSVPTKREAIVSGWSLRNGLVGMLTGSEKAVKRPSDSGTSGWQTQRCDADMMAS